MIAGLERHLVTADDRAPLRCVGVGVTHSELVVMTFDELGHDRAVLLLLRGRGVVLRVDASLAVPCKDGVFRSTLRCHDPAHDLVRLLEKEGLLGTLR